MISLKSKKDEKARTVTISLNFDASYMEGALKMINKPQNGSWLYPIVIDGFVSVEASGKDTPTIEVIEEKTKISWTIDPRDDSSKNWKINYIKFELIDVKSIDIPNEDYWNKVFNITGKDVVCPDGTLFIKPDNDERISIKTKDKIDSEFLLKYSVDFVNKPEGKRSSFYRIDPIIVIRPPE